MKYKNRQGIEFENTTLQDKLLKFMYATSLTRLIIKSTTLPCVSNICGTLLSAKFSKLLITPFIKFNNINMSEYKSTKYYSFNDFFTRRIKKEKRPMCNEDKALISPSDGKISVYKITKSQILNIKNSFYTVRTILKNQKLACEFEGGICIIIRLTVENYHRYCYCISGEKSNNENIKGILHTVNPVAYKYYPILKENTREYCIIKNDIFDKVIQMEVGALMVGRISNYKKKESIVQKGEEKGKFEFGGSTIVLFFKKHKVKIDNDIFENTKHGFETLVKYGEKIGEAIFY